MQGFGEYIKRHRIASGYKSQRSLAEKSGISAATISRIENEIQKPEVRTLKTLAEYLHTTSFVELMVVCGYWSEEELLEKELLEKEPNEESKENAKEFVKKIDLSDEELFEKYDLQIDGRSLTEEEFKMILTYLRSWREIKDN